MKCEYCEFLLRDSLYTWCSKVRWAGSTDRFQEVVAAGDDLWRDCVDFQHSIQVEF